MAFTPLLKPTANRFVYNGVVKLYNDETDILVSTFKYENGEYTPIANDLRIDNEGNYTDVYTDGNQPLRVEFYDQNKKLIYSARQHTDGSEVGGGGGGGATQPLLLRVNGVDYLYTATGAPVIVTIKSNNPLTFSDENGVVYDFSADGTAALDVMMNSMVLNGVAIYNPISGNTDITPVLEQFIQNVVGQSGNSPLVINDTTPITYTPAGGTLHLFPKSLTFIGETTTTYTPFGNFGNVEIQSNTLTFDTEHGLQTYTPFATTGLAQVVGFPKNELTVTLNGVLHKYTPAGNSVNVNIDTGDSLTNQDVIDMIQQYVSNPLELKAVMGTTAPSNTALLWFNTNANGAPVGTPPYVVNQWNGTDWSMVTSWNPIDFQIVDNSNDQSVHYWMDNSWRSLSFSISTGLLTIKDSNNNTIGTFDPSNPAGFTLTLPKTVHVDITSNGSLNDNSSMYIEKTLINIDNDGIQMATQAGSKMNLTPIDGVDISAGPSAPYITMTPNTEIDIDDGRNFVWLNSGGGVAANNTYTDFRSGDFDWADKIRSYIDRFKGIIFRSGAPTPGASPHGRISVLNDNHSTSSDPQGITMAVSNGTANKESIRLNRTSGFEMYPDVSDLNAGYVILDRSVTLSSTDGVISGLSGPPQYHSPGNSGVVYNWNGLSRCIIVQGGGTGVADIDLGPSLTHRYLTEGDIIVVCNAKSNTVNCTVRYWTTQSVTTPPLSLTLLQSRCAHFVLCGWNAGGVANRPIMLPDNV